MKKGVKIALTVIAIVLLICLGISIYTKIKDSHKEQTYEIIEEKEYSGVKKQGYTYDPKENILTIYLGERNTGGHGIKILKVEYNDVPDAIIEIEETSPKKGENATMAFTTPMIKIKLKQVVYDTHITNKTTGKVLSDYDE